MLIQINREHPNPRFIERLAAALKNGDLVAVPTGTTYGIAADLFNKRAIERIYMLKNHKRNKPLSLLCSDLSQVSQFAHVDNASFRLMKRCLPGPYTFILNATREVPHPMTGRRKTVGIRVPDEPIIRGILDALEAPLISTSAMSQDRAVFDCPKEIQKALGHAIAIVADVGDVPHEPSTIIDLSGAVPKLIRAGKGSLEALGIDLSEES